MKNLVIFIASVLALLTTGCDHYTYSIELSGTISDGAGNPVSKGLQGKICLATAILDSSKTVGYEIKETHCELVTTNNQGQYKVLMEGRKDIQGDRDKLVAYLDYFDKEIENTQTTGIPSADSLEDLDLVEIKIELDFNNPFLSDEAMESKIPASHDVVNLVLTNDLSSKDSKRRNLAGFLRKYALSLKPIEAYTILREISEVSLEEFNDSLIDFMGTRASTLNGFEREAFIRLSRGRKSRELVEQYGNI